MKKIACILLILSVLLALGACGKKETWRTDGESGNIAC